MADDDEVPQSVQPSPADPTPQEPARRRSPVDRVVIWLVVLVVVVVGVLLGITVLPRWWAGRVGSVTDRSLTAGVFAGLTCGVVFTAGPLLLLRLVVARHRSWRARGVWLLLAGLAGLPNLITLGIVLGTGSSARAAALVMDVDAPGFRGATGGGAVLGALLVIAWWTLWASRRRRVREVVRLRSQLALHEQAQRAQPQAPPDTQAPPDRE